MRDTWHTTMCKCRPVSLSLSLFVLCTLSPAWCQCISRSISVSLSPSFCHPSATYHSVFTLYNLCERESESSESKGGVVVDNVCKFVRDHPVLCNKYTALFCLLLCLFVSFFLSLSLRSFSSFQKTSPNLHPPSFALRLLHLSIHPSMHPCLPWLTVVSCRETVNNLSGGVVLSCPAPHFWLAAALRNIWWSARNPHTQGYHQ